MELVETVNDSISGIIGGITNFFGSVINVITTLKDLIKNFFTFIYDILYLIPTPFAQIIQIIITILIAIFIIKAVGVLL